MKNNAKFVEDMKELFKKYKASLNVSYNYYDGSSIWIRGEDVYVHNVESLCDDLKYYEEE